MKRRIGLFMVIVLLITSIPVSALADTSYPPVTVTFEAYRSDRSLENEFRELAALQLDDYRCDYEGYVAELYEACDVIQKYRSENTFGRLSLFNSDYSFNENIASFDDYYLENPAEATAYFKSYYMDVWPAPCRSALRFSSAGNTAERGKTSNTILRRERGIIR